MRAQCIICTDYLVINPTSEDGQIAAMPCGHTFHNTCLCTWLKNKRTCPQCRKQLGPRQEPIHKLYFVQDLDGSLTSEDQVAKAQNQLANVNLALQDANKERNSLATQLTEYVLQLTSLQESHNNTMNQLNKQKQMHHMLKKDLSFYKNEHISVQESRRTIGDLEAKIRHFERIERIISESESDISAMLGGRETADGQSRELATYASVIKRELKNVKSDRKVLQEENDKLRQAQRDQKKLILTQSSQLESLHAHLQTLEQDVDKLEGDKESLMSKLRSKATTTPQSYGSKPSSNAEDSHKKPSSQSSSSLRKRSIPDTDSHRKRRAIHSRLLMESPAPSFPTPNDREPQRMTSDQKRAFATPGTPFLYQRKKPSNSRIDPSHNSNELHRDHDHDLHDGKSPNEKSNNCAPSRPMAKDDSNKYKHALDSTRKHQSSMKITAKHLSSISIMRKKPRLGSNMFRQGYNGVGGHETYIAPSIGTSEHSSHNSNKGGNRKYSNPRVSQRKGLLLLEPPPSIRAMKEDFVTL